VDQQYLPDALVGRVYYEPSDQGMETQIGERLRRLLDARKG
jgi:putative ATPase